MTKIRKELPQFEGKRAILVVSSTRGNFKILKALDSHIDIVSLVNIPKDHYSDREGFFARSKWSPNKMETGSVYENKRQEQGRKHHKILISEIKNITKSDIIDLIYIFAPKQALRDLESVLPMGLRKKYVAGFAGNYYRLDNFSLLEMIKKKNDQAMEKNLVKPMSRKAFKLLKK